MSPTNRKRIIHQKYKLLENAPPPTSPTFLRSFFSRNFRGLGSSEGIRKRAPVNFSKILNSLPNFVGKAEKEEGGKGEKRRDPGCSSMVRRRPLGSPSAIV
ncbi:Protein CBG25950 [Caenorhabditis briggsae]|uniref:Protein CBG25950 n=1 Tax=Caenorhabditis briggsae TaxID=6238 RepID=B6IK82_CAEBR|nr:Protein CBG25950 [Caenorhabditis briggsae]CAS00312.1 Protein CBG25950 [Caenorhabditis briggsae]